MRTVLAIAVALVIAAAVAVFMVQKGPKLPDLSESDFGGKVYLVANSDARRLFALGAPVELDFAAKPRVKIKHPVGQAEGSVRTEGRRLIVTIDRVNGVSVENWDKEWPALRSKLIADRVDRAHRHPRPNNLDLALFAKRETSRKRSA